MAKFKSYGPPDGPRIAGQMGEARWALFVMDDDDPNMSFLADKLAQSRTRQLTCSEEDDVDEILGGVFFSYIKGRLDCQCPCNAPLDQMTMAGTA